MSRWLPNGCTCIAGCRAFVQTTIDFHSSNGMPSITVAAEENATTLRGTGHEQLYRHAQKSAELLSN
eukprot:5897497-Amphidinium_carterae.1